MREAVVSVEVHASHSIVTTEPLSSPGVVFVFPLQDVVGRLEEGLLDIEGAVDVQDGNNVECHVLKQIHVVLIVVESTMQELENDVEWHLYCDSLTCMMPSSKQNGRALDSWL